MSGTDHTRPLQRTCVFYAVSFGLIALVGTPCALVFIIHDLIESLLNTPSIAVTLPLGWFGIGVMLAWDTISNGGRAIATKRSVATWRNQFWFNALSWPLVLVLCFGPKTPGALVVTHIPSLEVLMVRIRSYWSVVFVAAWGVTLTCMALLAWVEASRHVEAQQPEELC